VVVSSRPGRRNRRLRLRRRPRRRPSRRLPVLRLEFLVVVLLVLGTGPALRLLGELEIELLPGLVVDFLDVAVLVLQLDELRVLVDRQDLEDLLVVETLVPLSGHRVVIAAH
jgi:hypothetical protein